jgi:hypothetical protein
MDESPPSSNPPPPSGAGDTAASGSGPSVEPGAGQPGSTLQARLVHEKPVRLGRYDVVGRVGLGGMGMVYEAINLEHGQRVALKTVRALSDVSLLRLKREFRRLARVAHPNLVTLHELVCADGEWFFTMEYVPGTSFADHVQGGAEPYLGTTFHEEDAPHEAVVPPLPREPTPPEGERPRASFQESRLRAALGPLAAGVAALHARGILHRDLSTSNVRVTPEGRVVVLDFGLSRDARPRAAAKAEGISGTPGYMSPEQAAGRAETPASDWYAFGATLFEALTGRLPFKEARGRILRLKQEVDAPAPSSLVVGVPADLEALCVALLERRPDDRPGGDEVLRRLGVARSPRRAGERPFVGRDEALGALGATLQRAGAGQAMAALVHGPAGSGKTALATRFADAVLERGTAVVLRGAVSAREAIPHRALDPIVDALGLHLRGLAVEDARALLPPEVHDLAQVFPVLGGVAALAPLPPERDDLDAVERGAFAALAEIVRRLVAAAPLLIWIDDVDQADSADLARLSLLLAAAPERAPMLLLTATDPLAGAPAGPLDAALARLPATVRRVRLDALPAADARQVALAALREAGGGRDRGAPALATTIARAASGWPRAIVELSRWEAEGGVELTVEAMLAVRLSRLSDPAQRLVEVLAAARAPLPLAVALAAAGIGPTPDPVSLVVRLDAARWVRARGVGLSDAISVGDERVRAVVTARVPASVQRRLHLDLAEALTRWPPVDPERVADHLELGGEPEAAAGQACLAASLAASSRDWERAAALYARALGWLPPRSAAAHVASVRHAEALGGAGRAAEAARAFLGAAAGATASEAQDLRRRAAEHLLVAGRIDAGLSLLRPVLAAYGLRYPDTSRAALFVLAARLVQLRLRGTLPATLDGPPPATTRARVDAAWSAGKGLSTVDPIRSSVFMVDALLGALATGDPALVARSLAFVGAIHVYDGGAAQEARGAELIEEAARVARRTGDPYLMGFTWCCSGLARMCVGRWREALARLDEGLTTLETGGGCALWERHAARAAGSQALFALGALRERGRRAEAARAEARAHGDRLGEVDGTLVLAFARIAAGDPAGARAEIAQAMDSFFDRAFTVQHSMAAWLGASSHLYEGHPAAAWSVLEATRSALEASQLLRMQLARIDVLLLRGVVAAACAAEGRDAAGHLAEADLAAARLGRERRSHALAAAAVVRAGAARARGDRARAVEQLRAAASGYDAVEMKVHAACARRAAGSLLGGVEGAALVARADEVLRGEGVVDPAAWARLYTGLAG